MRPNPTMITELGLERLCRGCGEFWPVDATFWYFTRRGKVLGRCRACWAERRTVDGRKTPMGPLLA